MVRYATLFCLMATAANAFTVPPTVSNRAATMVSPTAQNLIISDEETKAILGKAEECVASECSVGDVGELISELKETEKELSARLDKVMNMVATLQHANEKKTRKTEEVRNFVKDMLRVFNTEKPMAFPTGFAGDVGDGPMTAYDVLPPKKWKGNSV